MTGSDENCNYNMPLTLERYFEKLRERDCDGSVKELHSVWVMLKKHIEDEISHSRNVFVNYSLHDASHSRSIIQAIERFLGEERISRLSATDTFMLLACAYAHDYGMAQTFDRIYSILGSRKFKDFLQELDKNQGTLEKEDLWAVRNLLCYLNEAKTSCSLEDMYLSIMLVAQMYLRPLHWRGVIDIGEDFQGLFHGYVKNRFVRGSEGIVEICMCHGQPMEAVFKLSDRADGMVGDEFHPRFIAAMLRLGDLLDLDNGRFPLWFVREAVRDHSIIPRLSVLHYRKHEAVSHLLITPKRIEIRADCGTEADQYEVASLVSEWTGWLEEECRHLVASWNEIAQPDFGRPPSNVKIDIFVDGRPYTSTNKKMHMSRERVMKLLQGTNIYGDRYVGIREIIQNAVDASLLQLWYDIIQNRYVSYGLSKNTARDGLEFLDLLDEMRFDIFGNYDITVELILDRREEEVYVVVKDRGIGIVPEDVEYISDIGSSKEKNKRVRDLMENMPVWLKPSGAFGIGLQSVFQLTERVEFYTRQHNLPERRISLQSNGNIEIREVKPNVGGPYFDNAVPGTNVKIAVDIQKLMRDGDGGGNPKPFLYYDCEFDEEGELDMLFAELGHACEDKLKESRYDYFNIFYQSMKIEKDGNIIKGEKRCLRRSYFCPVMRKRNLKTMKLAFGETFQSLLQDEKSRCNFINNMAYFWDKENNRCYHLTIRPCMIEDRYGAKQVYLPEVIRNPYKVSYKFNVISDTDTIYPLSYRSGRLHAGFLDWEILILDDNPTKYLNIDRDSLREGAVSEEELLTVCKVILEEWCEYFCRLDAEKEKKRLEKIEKEKKRLEHAGKERKYSEDSIKDENRFRSTPEILLSLVFLFYQNVPLERFREFMKPYQEFLKKSGYVLGKERRSVTYFWDSDRQFQATLDLPRKFLAIASDMEKREAIEIEPDLVKHLPHRLIHIEEILNSRDLKLMYYFRLFMPNDEMNAIHMSEAARLYDYMKALDAYDNQEQRVDYSSLQKKVFKPNADFSHLLLPRYPHTFQKGRNLTASLDYCISWYILSPFDKDTANILKDGIENGTDVGTELVEAVMKSRQLEKCIRYIQKLRYAGAADPDKMETVVRQEYRAFLEDFWELFYKNNSMVKEQFLKGEAAGQEYGMAGKE